MSLFHGILSAGDFVPQWELEKDDSKEVAQFAIMGWGDRTSGGQNLLPQRNYMLHNVNIYYSQKQWKHVQIFVHEYNYY